jgi:dihydroorotate dehydrogenase (fumarate)
MDLSTRYLGLALRNPLVASASPISNTLDGVRRLADAGVGAVVLFSLFEEQLRREAERSARLADAGTDSFAESLSYFPAGADSYAGPRRYLSLLERAAAAVDIPVIGSLNGVTPGGWTSYARAIQDAGAAAIELNIYYLPGDPHTSGREVEQRHIDILCRVKDAVTVPVAVKLGPHFSSFGEIALRLDAAGADGLVLFNRFLQPDIDPRLSRCGPRWTCPARPKPGCRAPGSPCCATICADPSRRPPASKDQPMWSSTCWPAPTW